MVTSQIQQLIAQARLAEALDKLQESVPTHLNVPANSVAIVGWRRLKVADILKRDMADI